MTSAGSDVTPPPPININENPIQNPGDRLIQVRIGDDGYFSSITSKNSAGNPTQLLIFKEQAGRSLVASWALNNLSIGCEKQLNHVRNA